MSSPEVVLVTGANTGIGFQIVRALAGSDKTYSIILAGRSLDKVQQAIKDLQEKFPDSKSALSPLELDIESDRSIEAAFETVTGQFGKVDVLINNAGRCSLDGMASDCTDEATCTGAQFDQEIGKAMTMREAWNADWNVNVAGTQVMTHTFVPLLLASSSPRLLFMASGTSSLSRTEGGHLPINQPAKAGWPKEGFNVAGYRSAKCGMNMMVQVCVIAHCRCTELTF